MQIKTQVEFLNKFNKQSTGWGHTGINPFSKKNLENEKLQASLSLFVDSFIPGVIIDIPHYFNSLKPIDCIYLTITDKNGLTHLNNTTVSVNKDTNIEQLISETAAELSRNTGIPESSFMTSYSLTLPKMTKVKEKPMVNFEKLNDLFNTITDDNFKLWLDLMKKNPSFAQKSHYELKNNNKKVFKSGWYLIDCNGEQIEGTYPYVITHFNSKKDVKVLYQLYPDVGPIEHIDISSIESIDVLYKDCMFQCESFEEEKARLVVIKDLGYDIKDVITSSCIE